jgi:hypothetical protein
LAIKASVVLADTPATVAVTVALPLDVELGTVTLTVEPELPLVGFSERLEFEELRFEKADEDPLFVEVRTTEVVVLPELGMTMQAGDRLMTEPVVPEQDVLKVTRLPSVLFGVAMATVPLGPVAVAVKVTDCATELETVKIAVPVLVVTVLAGETVRLVFGLGTRVTVSLLVSGVPLELRSATVMVVLKPVTTQAFGAASMRDCEASGVQTAVPLSQRTAAVWVTGVPLMVAVKVTVSATVSVTEKVTWPLAFVVAGVEAPITALEELGDLARVTVAPLMGRLPASLAVTVTVVAEPATRHVGEALTVRV